MLLVLLCPCAVNTFALTMTRKDLDGSIVSLLSAALKAVSYTHLTLPTILLV